MSAKHEKPMVNFYVTNKCPFECIYCDRSSIDREELEAELPLDYLSKYISAVYKEGYRRIKFSSRWGDPLMRLDLEDLINEASQLGFEDISLSTNGAKLVNRVESLKNSGLHRMCVSLDTLDPEKYERIVGLDVFDNVIAGIESAAEIFNGNVKINIVVLAGINDEEINTLIEWALERNITPQLIEVCGSDQPELIDEYFFNLDSLVRRLSRKASLIAYDRLDKRTTVILLEGSIEIRQSRKWPDKYYSGERMMIHPNGEIGLYYHCRTGISPTVYAVDDIRKAIKEVNALGANPEEVERAADVGNPPMVS